MKIKRIIVLSFILIFGCFGLVFADMQSDAAVDYYNNLDHEYKVVFNLRKYGVDAMTYFVVYSDSPFTVDGTRFSSSDSELGFINVRADGSCEFGTKPANSTAYLRAPFTCLSEDEKFFIASKDIYNSSGEVFFSVPSPTEEILPIMVGQVTMILPIGLGILGLMISLAVLPKVLYRFF